MALQDAGKKGGKLGRRLKRGLMGVAERVDFVALLRRIASTPGGRPLLERFHSAPPDHPDQVGLLDRCVELTLAQLAAEGLPADPAKVRALAGEISCQYDPEIHPYGAAGINVVMGYLFDHADPMLPFISRDRRELAHLNLLKQYRRKGLGVVYLVNHSSHVDEFIADVVFNAVGLGLPLFAAGTNMMAIRSLARLLMIGSYTVRRKGAGRVYLATLYNYCRAISKSGGMQGIFLEAWAGGARSRDGSLRYPRRLVTLRGAIDVANEVVMQPVAISYSAVPEDLSLAARAGTTCWMRGPSFLQVLSQLLMNPKKGLLQAYKGLYGRAYLTMPRPRLLSKLKAEHAQARGDLGQDTFMALDEFVALTAIKDIAAAKKVMASQLTARALIRARSDKLFDLSAALANELKGLKVYHQAAFGCQPDLEDLIVECPLTEVLKDGLNTLARRAVVSRCKAAKGGLSKVKNEKGLAFYATHGDRRLYSPQARENIVVAGGGDWGFALAHLVGNRILEDKRYLHHSLTLFDARPEAAEQLGVMRFAPGRFEKYRLPKNAFVTSDPQSAFKKASEVILAVPPSCLAQQAAQMLDHAEQGLRVIVAACGFEPQTGLLPCQVVADEARRRGRQDVEVFSMVGPVSEEDLVLLNPAKGVLAGPAPGAQELADLFHWPPVETAGSTADALGVQLAGVLAHVYSLWGGFLQKTGRMTTPAQVGHYMADSSAEALALGLSLGADPATFSAASPAWTATYAAVGLASPALDLGRRLGREAKKNRDVAAAVQKYLKQQEQEGAKKTTVLQDLGLAARLARRMGLTLPILEEAEHILQSDRHPA
jgi:glycerol-3-phosphate dehydrogenase/GNAT superfamily N-acetyltransferase